MEEKRREEKRREEKRREEFRQIAYFIQDYKVATGKHWFRGLYMWMSWTIIGIFTYRLERLLFLLLGRVYGVLRLPFYPVIMFILALSKIDIHYKCSIKGGIKILHASAGVVINGNCIIGKNLTLTGGNIIGGKKAFASGEYVIGDNVYLGANATVIGPLLIGNNVQIGASACVTKSIPDNCIAAGVPAKIIKSNK